MPAVGPPATGKDFFDRKRETQTIIRSLNHKNSVLLIAPRRYGKTSIMRKVEQTFQAEGHVCIFLDVMPIKKPSDFILNLADSYFSTSTRTIREKFIEHLKGAVNRIEEIGADGTGVRIKFRDTLKQDITDETWMKRGEEILKALAQTEEKKPALLILDELADCIENISKIDKETAVNFLQWLRNQRLGMSDDIRFLVGGSTSFDMIVSRLDPIDGLSLINDFERVVIDGFQAEDALELIKDFFKEAELKYSNECGEKILECIGEPYIPYFISVLLSRIQQDCEKKVTPQEIDKIYLQKLLGSPGKGYFEYYRQRLGKYPEGLSKASHSILREVSLSKEGYPTDLAFGVFKSSSGIDDYDKFRELLECLSNDFYIDLEEKRISFKSKVLKDWWKKYYG